MRCVRSRVGVSACYGSVGDVAPCLWMANVIGAAFGGELPQLVLVSPLRRTMQTFALGFGADAVPVVLRPDLQETGNMPCDRAMPELGKAMLAERGWSALAEAYGQLPDGWDLKGPKWGASAPSRRPGSRPAWAPWYCPGRVPSAGGSSS